MRIQGGSHAQEASNKAMGDGGLWQRIMSFLEMAGRGASMAPFVGEREMRIVVRGE